MKLRGKAACLPFAIIFAVLAWLFSQFFDEATSRTLSIGVIVAVIVGLMIYGNMMRNKNDGDGN